MAEAPKTWSLTGSPDNFAATRERGFTLIGMRGRRRGMAEQVEPGPLEHWRLAFQGQLRAVSDADAELLVDRLRAAAGARA
jgi:hypothetical protein